MIPTADHFFFQSSKPTSLDSQPNSPHKFPKKVANWECESNEIPSPPVWPMAALRFSWDLA
ncbi:uncharacterized protein BDZ83DRAFT_624938 [Colletotrichum acutatum]|uniref:Uncharacterized protein n=1 Tax=Glomerella acutata TaxID=27357 RepID=A0AAD8ULQ8_GLOAC|nr:uncharacterized protein BDZ83DRAFT_624938 [Colletotrichum acutatum]KAK1723863.1 hypothetical protein BDZ83DRAFT_624938 [Colletotrichum acutatum]